MSGPVRPPNGPTAPAAAPSIPAPHPEPTREDVDRALRRLDVLSRRRRRRTRRTPLVLGR